MLLWEDDHDVVDLAGHPDTRVVQFVPARHAVPDPGHLAGRGLTLNQRLLGWLVLGWFWALAVVALFGAVDSWGRP